MVEDENLNPWAEFRSKRGFLPVDVVELARKLRELRRELEWQWSKTNELALTIANALDELEREPGWGDYEGRRQQVIAVLTSVGLGKDE